MQAQTKILSATQVKNNFGSLIQQVYSGQVSEVIVQNHGAPIVAVVSIEELECLKEVRQEKKQHDALARLQNLRNRIQARLKGKLPDKEVEEIAQRFSGEFVGDLEKEGKIRFEK